jgi:hypothetical protein
VTREPLTADYLEECQRRARRFQGQWTGTGGALAADVMRLLWEVDRLKVELARRDELRRPLPPLGYFSE